MSIIFFEDVLFSDVAGGLGTSKGQSNPRKKKPEQAKLHSILGKGLLGPEFEKSRQIRRANRPLRMERDIFKKKSVFSEKPQYIRGGVDLQKNIQCSLGGQDCYFRVN